MAEDPFAYEFADDEDIKALHRAYVTAPGFERLLRFAKREGLLGEFLRRTFPPPSSPERSILPKTKPSRDRTSRR